MRQRFDHVAFALHGHEPDDVRREILRIGVLLANVHVWVSLKFTTFRKTEVFARLGIPAGIRTYQDWFGRRPGASIERGRSELHVRPLDVFKNVVNGTESLFLEWDESDLTVEDKSRGATLLEGV